MPRQDDLPAPSASNPFPELTDAQASDPHIAQFVVAIARGMAAGMSRGQAIKKVASEKPELHRAYLARINVSA